MVKQYSGKDVKVSYLGAPLLVQSISYEVTKEKKSIFTMGEEDAVSSVTKRKEVKGEIKVLQSEFERLVASLPEGNDPTDIEASDMVVVYINKSNLMVTDIFKDMEITSWKKEMDVESDNMVITMPVIMRKVILNSK